jgi:hypothetical protein
MSRTPSSLGPIRIRARCDRSRHQRLESHPLRYAFRPTSHIDTRYKMDTRTIYLISACNTTFQPANFSTMRERNQGPRRQRSYGRLSPSIKTKLQPKYGATRPALPIGEVHSSLIIDSSTDAPPRIDPTPRGNIELAAAEAPTPGISQNFMAPVIM